ncbi:MAG: nucleotidyl transferase AbiEii/AbiGii toxin family protein [Saprospiraceae bacterium]|nr:nucleotidyl transferase AbiEii/AbiGii toxin family protein [Saprospiraceae bacterium]
MPEMQDFSLVGGTALSLLYGHRISEDLDLFSNISFNRDILINSFKVKFKSAFILEDKGQAFGLFCYIDDIKVDIIKHPHPFIREINIIDKLRFFSTEDIIAMKVQAILGRGKKKDFWDVAELLHHFTVADFVNFHKEKYFTQNLFISVPQALTYFVDADESEDPISLKGQSWESVKAFISGKVREYLA